MIQNKPLLLESKVDNVRRSYLLGSNQVLQIGNLQEHLKYVL